MSKATLKIEFAGAGADSGLYMAAIADFERNTEIVDGKRQEKTTFYPGDIFNFLVQVDPKLLIREVRSSWGLVQPLGTVSRPHTEGVELRAETETKETAHIPASGISSVWYGHSPALDQVGRALSYRSGPVPATGTISYRAAWQSYRLVPGALSLEPEDEWPVLIVAYVEVRP